MKGPGRDSSFILIMKNQYLVTLALVSPRRNRRSRAQTPIFTIGNQQFLVQMARARPKPCPGQILKIWGPGNPEICNPNNKKKVSKFKSVLPKMSARSGLARERRRVAHLGPFQAIFSMDRKKKNKKQIDHICLFPLVGQWALFTRFGVMCWCH